MGFQERENARKKPSVVESMINIEHKKTKPVGRPKVEREVKRRANITIMPSLYEDLQAIAYVERRSASEIISECIEKYVSENQSALKEYKKIEKGRK